MSGKEAGGKGRGETDRLHGLPYARALGAELLGTFALATVAAGMIVVGAALHHPPSDAVHFAAPGLLVMAIIYALGDISGAHINPAVTLAFALRGVFPARCVPAYWLCQIGGAVLGAALLRAVFGMAGNLGVSRARYGLGGPFVMEVVLTIFLVLVILGTADGSRLVGSNAGIAVGGAIVMDGYLGGPVSGASMNPARSLGPALVGGHLEHIWIYVAGPLTGSVLAVFLVWLLRGTPPPHEAKAAMGEKAGEDKGQDAKKEG